MASLRHELRTPIHQILGYSELVAEEAEAEGHGQYLPDLARISVAARNLLALVDRLPDLPQEALAPGAPEPMVQEAPADLPSGAPGPPEAPADGPRVLVVDDDDANRDLLARRLRRGGYRVSTAVDGPDALRMARTGPFDLVLLDVTMPGMDGYEVCSRLREEEATRRTPVIFVTALSEDRDEAHGLELGAVDYITKPFNPALLLARVKNHLELKSYRDHLEDEVARRTRELVDETAARQKLESELSVARDLQRSMLPDMRFADPRHGGWEVAAVLEPARAVGGDLVDYFPLDDGRLCFAMGDVSDKGVPAALFMVRTLTLLRTLAPRSTSPGELLAALNDALCQDNEACMFVTMAVGMAHLEDGVLRLASGGHEPPLLVPARGEARFLSWEGGAALGLMEGARYDDLEIVLAPGDTLLLYTDGVTEASDPEHRMFGTDRLLEAARPGGAADLVGEVARRAAAFTGPAEPFDDLALLAVGRGREPMKETLTLRNRLPEISGLQHRLEHLLGRCGCSRDTIHDLCVVAEEILANTISYGYEGPDERIIEVRLEASQGTVRLEFRDDGRPFDPLAREEPGLDAEEGLGGLGIPLIREFTDHCEYAREGDFNVLRLERADRCH